ncbi:MAG: hypothetical protein ACTSP1_09750 [Candidatus Freyarchaeota archaeon]
MVEKVKENLQILLNVGEDEREKSVLSQVTGINSDKIQRLLKEISELPLGLQRFL